MNRYMMRSSCTTVLLSSQARTGSISMQILVAFLIVSSVQGLVDMEEFISDLDLPGERHCRLFPQDQ